MALWLKHGCSGDLCSWNTFPAHGHTLRFGHHDPATNYADGPAATRMAAAALTPDVADQSTPLAATPLLVPGQAAWPDTPKWWSEPRSAWPTKWTALCRSRTLISMCIKRMAAGIGRNMQEQQLGPSDGDRGRVSVASAGGEG